MLFCALNAVKGMVINMKKLSVIVGILSIIVCAIFLLLAALNMHGYYNLIDGTARHYNRLHQRMIVSFVIGIIFAGIGSACIIIRSKL